MRHFYLYTICFILLVYSILAGFVLKIPIYKYNKETKLWDLKNFEDIVKYSMSHDDSKEKMEMNFKGSNKVGSKNVQWFFFVEYTISESINAKKYNLWVDRDQNVGNVTIWNDDKILYILFKTNTWFLEETNIMIMREKPVGDILISSFPYTTKYRPILKKVTCSIPLNWKKREKVYILAHALIVKNSKHGNNLKKDAWCGEADSYMELYLSATKITWIVKRPGIFFSKVLEGSITSSHQTVMSLSSFNDPKNDSDKIIPTFYAFTNNIPSEWVSSSAINGMKFRFSNGINIFNIWQKIQLDAQSTSIFKNKGVITFTICNMKVYTDN